MPHGALLGQVVSSNRANAQLRVRVKVTRAATGWVGPDSLHYSDVSLLDPETRLQYWLRTLFVIPMVMPGIAVILLWVQIYDPNIGLVNEILRTIGQGQLARAWLADEQTALWAIVGAGFPYVSAFALLIYLGGLAFDTEVAMDESEFQI